jgi:hypothetical protein
MKKTYVKPVMLLAREPVALIPAILGVGMALGSALGAAASASAALGGLAVGAGLGIAAGGAVAAGTALSQKHHLDSWYQLPTLDVVEVYA